MLQPWKKGYCVQPLFDSKELKARLDTMIFKSRPVPKRKAGLFFKVRSIESKEYRVFPFTHIHTFSPHSFIPCFCLQQTCTIPWRDELQEECMGGKRVFVFYQHIPFASKIEPHPHIFFMIDAVPRWADTMFGLQTTDFCSLSAKSVLGRAPHVEILLC